MAKYAKLPATIPANRDPDVERKIKRLGVEYFRHDGAAYYPPDGVGAEMIGTCTVLIGGPTREGLIDARTANSIASAVKACVNAKVQATTLWITGDEPACLQRDQILKIALENNVHTLVLVDPYLFFDPTDLIRLLTHCVDVVGAAVPRRVAGGGFRILKGESENRDEDTGLVEVRGMAASFLRLSRPAMEALWGASPEYRIGPRLVRAAFARPVVDGVLYDDGVWACKTLRENGFKIFLDPEIKLRATGEKVFDGNG